MRRASPPPAGRTLARIRPVVLLALLATLGSWGTGSAAAAAISPVTVGPSLHTVHMLATAVPSPERRVLPVPLASDPDAGLPAAPGPTEPAPGPTDTPVDPTPTTDPADPVDPTPSPTDAPSEPPTEQPSGQPTVPPSQEPTDDPSPTAEPTEDATQAPPPEEPGVVERPATPPAVRRSTVGPVTLVVSLLVLAGAGLLVRRLARRSAAADEYAATTSPAATSPTATTLATSLAVTATVPEATRPTADPGPVTADPSAHPPSDLASNAAHTHALVLFLVQLGEAMIDSGDLVNHVTETLGTVARVQGAPEADVVVLPTALIVTIPGVDSVRTAVASAGTSKLRLDQIDAVFRVVREAETGALTPAEGIARLRAARALDPPFSPWVRVVGYAVLTVGLALILRAGWTDVVVAAALGLLVGLLQVGGTRLGPTYRVFGPFLNAFLVAVAVFLAAGSIPSMGVYAPLIAPLVTFLPGALLTTSVIELTTGQMISGAGRLAAGVMQLVLLAFGIVAGGQLVGIPATSVDQATATPIGAWAPWVGVALFAAGVVLHHGARPESAGWIGLVLLVAYAGQVVGGLLFGGVLSAFVGALLMTPVAVFAAAQRSGPPTLVSFLPAFWLLVPGALGLVGVTQLIGADRVDGVTSLVTTGATMVAIAFGVLLGLAAGAGALSGVSRVLGERDAQPPSRAA